MEIIERPQYLQQLKEKRHNGLVKIITGIRRCGKSFLLFKLYKTYLLNDGIDETHIIEITLDGIQNAALRDPITCFSFIQDKIIDSDMYYLFLDEIQFMARFEEVLNGLLRIENIDIYVTGSNSKFLSSDIATEFRGRGDEVRLFPLSFSEYMSVSKDSFDISWEDYLIYGGLPKVALMDSDDNKSEYLFNVVENVYLSDIIDRNNISKTDEVQTLLEVISSNIGALTSPSKISNTFASNLNVVYTYKTIAKHIDYFIDAFLLSRAQRYDVKGRKYIGSTQKYYFTDCGIRNAVINFRQIELNHLMENAVYNELLVRRYNVDVGCIDVFETNSGTKSRKQLEVDFVVNNGSRRYYIQVASNIDSDTKRNQELRPLNKISDFFKKIIIVDNINKSWMNDQGVLILPMKQFLLDKNSLES